MSNNSSRKVGFWLATCLATVAFTLVVAFELWAPASRDASFQLSLVMLCVAECVVLLFPALQVSNRANSSAPRLLFNMAFQARLGLYATGVVVLCALSAIPGMITFTWLVLLHAGWLLLLFVSACALQLGSAFANEIAAESTARRVAFAQVRHAVQGIASGLALERDAAWAPLVAQTGRLNDDTEYSTPETLPGTEPFNDRLMAALERLSHDIAEARSHGADLRPRVTALVDQARAITHLLRERNDAMRAAR